MADASSVGLGAVLLQADTDNDLFRPVSVSLAVQPGGCPAGVAVHIGERPCACSTCGKAVFSSSCARIGAPPPQSRAVRVSVGLPNRVREGHAVEFRHNAMHLGSESCAARTWSQKLLCTADMACRVLSSEGKSFSMLERSGRRWDENAGAGPRSRPGTRRCTT